MAETTPTPESTEPSRPVTNGRPLSKKYKIGLTVGIFCLGLLVCFLLARTSYRQYQQDRLNSALVFAAMTGNDSAVPLLLRQGADPNGRVPDNLPPDFSGFCLQLFRGGRQSSPKNNTALMYAAGNGNLTMIQHLLDAGAEVNARNASEFTPVMWAVYEGRKQNGPAILLLAEYGADLNVKEVGGATLWSLARTKPDILKALQQAAALPPGMRRKIR